MSKPFDSTTRVALAPNGEAPVILAVDDDDSNLHLLKRPMTKEGYRLLLADSGPKALEILLSERVDLVLLDWMMPVMSGIELCEKIRSTDRICHIPVIMVTARTSTEDLSTALEAGASDFIRKPVDRQELKARVRAGLREYFVRMQLAAANERLSELNRMKNDFLSVASHDLRSPLTAIYGFATAILDGSVGEKPSAKQVHPLEIIRKSATRQLKLIDSLLDIARIEAGSFNLERGEINLNKVVRECVDSMMSIATMKRVEMTFVAPEEEITIFADDAKLSQVFNNLISNAVKFTPSGGAVTLTLSRGGGGDVTVSVRDTGVGISHDKIEDVFGRFSDAQRTGTAGEKGTGLGLSIVKNVVELHGGGMRLESALGKGSCFFVTLPCHDRKLV